MGGGGKETCHVGQITTSFKGQVEYFVEKTVTDSITMSEEQIRTALADLRSKIALCKNEEEARKAHKVLDVYLKSVNSAK